MFTESKCELMSARRHCKIRNRAEIFLELASNFEQEKQRSEKSQTVAAAFS
jgi:hypothetical protein